MFLLRRVQTAAFDRPRAPQFAWCVVAIVCLLLLAFMAVVQVTHIHASASDADHCAVCMAMHSAVPLSILLVTVVLIRIGRPVLVVLQVRAICRYWHPTLFNRPPPATR